MSMFTIRDKFGVPAERYGRVRRKDGKLGTITSASETFLSIRWDGAPQEHVFAHHPLDLEYLPKVPKKPRYYTEDEGDS